MYDALENLDPDLGWAVAHVRPRCEKKLAAFCREQEIPCYLPTIEKTRIYGARKRTSELPLFPGYLFCKTNDQTALTVQQNQNTARLLRVADGETLAAQLRQVKQALDSGMKVEVMDFIAEGNTVTINSGAFKGMKGIVTTIHDQNKIVLNVDFIQHAVMLTVDPTMLSPSE